MINVVYCTDDKLFGQQLLSILTLADSTREVLNCINLTVECKEYSPKGRKTQKWQDDFLTGILKRFNPASRFRSIDVSDLFREHLLKGPNVSCKYYSYFVTVRLLTDLVEQVPDKVIYLDSDVLINNDIKGLWDIDVEGYDFAGRKDKFRIGKYLQSGVMLLNMRQIRTDGSFAMARKIVTTKKLICYLDMTAINWACKKRKAISKIYNSYEFIPDCICHHVCDTREGRIPLTKKWRHRIKPDEVELMRKHYPNYRELYDRFEVEMEKARQRKMAVEETY